MNLTKTVLFSIALAACGDGSLMTTHPADMKPGTICKSIVLADGLSGTINLAVVQGTIDQGCDGSFTCTGTSPCRLEVIYSQTAKTPIGPVVQTQSGVINLSDRVEVLGSTTNGNIAAERLSLCGYDQNFAYLYVAMSAGAKVSQIEFIKTTVLCP